MVNDAGGWGFVEKINSDGESDVFEYKPEWIKEAWSRERNLIIIDATIPVVINGKKNLVEKIKALDKDIKVKVYGVIKKKVLKYHVKRTLYYLDVESIQNNSNEMALISGKGVISY